ncbi:reverse transcriptase [Trichonephila clavipes]|nr:reverse transcriptase [Trichonephila clavipes]
MLLIITSNVNRIHLKKGETETLAIASPIPTSLGPAEVVTCFRLTTGHDFLGVYHHWLGFPVDEDCPLCSHTRMDDDHLLQCTGLDDYPADNVVSRYREAWRQMVKKPSMTVE